MIHKSEIKRGMLIEYFDNFMYTNHEIKHPDGLTDKQKQALMDNKQYGIYDLGIVLNEPNRYGSVKIYWFGQRDILNWTPLDYNDENDDVTAEVFTYLFAVPEKS